MTRSLVALLAVLLGTCTPAYAEPCRRAVHVEAGASVPCSGDLLPPSEVLRLLLLEDAAELAREQFANERDLRAIDADEAAELLAVSEAARRACETQHAPPPARARRWYESPWVGFGAGVVITGTLAVALAVSL